MTLAVFDIEGFGTRNDADQMWLHGQLLKLVKSAAKRAGIPWRKCVLVNRGDGLALLMPGSVSKATVATAFLREVLIGQRAHNRRCRPPAAMRLRLALHAGEIERGSNGWVGTDLNIACRLVDAAKLRHALRATPQAQLVLCVSNEWFHTVIERNPDLFDHRSYTPITIIEKELETTAWLHIPTHLPAQPQTTQVTPNGRSQHGDSSV